MIKVVAANSTDTITEKEIIDYAIVLIFMHELPIEKQLCVLSEALRVADKTIIVDATVPLPKNPRGLGVRFVEATFGRDHHGYFKDFLATVASRASWRIRAYPSP